MKNEILEIQNIIIKIKPIVRAQRSKDFVHGTALLTVNAIDAAVCSRLLPQEIVADLLDGLAPGVRHDGRDEHEREQRQGPVQSEHARAQPYAQVRVRLDGHEVEHGRHARDDGTRDAGHVGGEQLAEHGVRYGPQSQTVHGHVEQHATDDHGVYDQRVAAAVAQQERGQQDHGRGVTGARHVRQLLETEPAEQHGQQDHGRQVGEPSEQRHQVSVDGDAEAAEQLDHVRGQHERTARLLEEQERRHDRHRLVHVRLGQPVHDPGPQPHRGRRVAVQRLGPARLQYGLGDAQHPLRELGVHAAALSEQPGRALGYERADEYERGQRHERRHVSDHVRGHQRAQQIGEEHAEVEHDGRYYGEAPAQPRVVDRDALGRVHRGRGSGQAHRQADQQLARVQHVQAGRLPGQQQPAQARRQVGHHQRRLPAELVDQRPAQQATDRHHRGR